jgi:very-short-patch-repair endonuclease
MKRINNRHELIGLRKKLRNKGTCAEAVMWNILKHSQVGGLKFRRQHSIGPYVADFYCPELKLVLELDGHYHQTPGGKEHDRRRDQYFCGLGITTLRFENEWVFDRAWDIADAILDFRNIVESEGININNHPNL